MVMPALRVTKAARHAVQVLLMTALNVPLEEHLSTEVMESKAPVEKAAQQAKAAAPAKRVGSLSMVLATALSAPQRQNILRMGSVPQQLLVPQPLVRPEMLPRAHAAHAPMGFFV